MTVNNEEIRTLKQQSCMSAQDATHGKAALGTIGGNLKSIDEYKAQINNQIRPP